MKIILDNCSNPEEAKLFKITFYMSCEVALCGEKEREKVVIQTEQKLQTL